MSRYGPTGLALAMLLAGCAAPQAGDGPAPTEGAAAGTKPVVTVFATAT